MALTLKEEKELFEKFKKELAVAQKVYVETCREGVELPNYANIGDAGMDIRAAKETILLPGETKIIPTGLKMAIPEGFELQVRPRSGLSINTPLRIANTPGTIDSGYRDEIGIIVSNSSPILAYNIHQNNYNGELSYRTPTYYNKMFFGIDEKENKPGAYVIKVGDRIAQIILSKYEKIEFVAVNDIKTLGLNRGGGFGSTGTK